jgi:hypothetical protein
MAEDRHGPPPGLSEEERRRWWRWRRFVWGPGDLRIVKRGDGERAQEDAGGEREGRPAGEENHGE